MDAVTATGRGAAALGEGITSLGASIQQRADQEEELDVRRRLLEFEQAQHRALDDSRRTLTGDPAGFAGRTVASLTEAGRGVFAGAQEAGLSPRALTRLAHGLSDVRDRAHSSAFTAEMGQRGAYGEQWTTERLNGLTQDYMAAPDDEARQRILDSAERTIALGRQTYGFSTETEQRLRGTARQMIEQDILSRPDGYSALMELRSGDPRVRAPSTGEISDTQLQRLARRPGMTPAELQAAVTGLRTQAGEVSRLIREGLSDGVSLTQAQHDALVSFGLARGTDALQELMPSVNSSGPGRLSSLAQAMRTPGGLTAMEQPAPGGQSPTTPPPGQSRPVPRFAPEVDSAIAAAAERHGVDPDLMRRIAAIESSGDPRAVTGSYRGLFQLSEQEFGGRGDIFSPGDNAEAAAANFARHVASFRQQHGRDPTAGELYLIHQQGAGGFAAHMAQPERLAWQSMLATGEGRQRGERWARQAISGNLPPRVLAQLGGIENVTSQQFMGYWRGRVEGAAPGGQASPDAPSTDPRIAELADLVQGNAPAGRYASLPADRRRVLIRELSQALRTDTAAGIDSDIASITTTGRPRPLPDGTTWLERARRAGIFTPMQLAQYTRRIREAEARFRAIDGLSDRSPQEMGEHLEDLDTANVGDGEDYALAGRVRQATARAISRIEQLRRTDPSLWASGTYLLGQAGLPRHNQDGSVASTPAEDDLRVRPAREVEDAYDALARRYPHLQIQIGEDGEITYRPESGALGEGQSQPQRLLLTDQRLRPADRQLIIDARLAAMTRVGIPEGDRYILRGDEAAQILRLPADLARLSANEFTQHLRTAADRATELFGPRYARAAFDAALHFRRLSGERLQDAQGVSGTLGRRLAALDREEALWSIGAPPVGFSSQFGQPLPGAMPMGPPSDGLAPMSGIPGYGPVSGLPGPAPTPGARPSGAPLPVSPPPRATGVPGVSQQAWPRPTPEMISRLARLPAMQEEFDRTFGPGTAAHYLNLLGQSQPPRR
jgi:hypothetical protein